MNQAAIDSLCDQSKTIPQMYEASMAISHLIRRRLNGYSYHRNQYNPYTITLTKKCTKYIISFWLQPMDNLVSPEDQLAFISIDRETTMTNGVRHYKIIAPVIRAEDIGEVIWFLEDEKVLTTKNNQPTTLKTASTTIE